jgi:transposase
VVITRHIRLVTYRGHCPHCGPVHSTHPEQVSTAVGAAGTHLGRNALALAASLNKQFGLPMRKVCAILQQHFGLSLTPGGLSQALVRMAERLQAPYQQLQDAVRESDVIHADETGWWLGGKSAWLWVFTNPQLTLYAIDNRSQQVVRRILGDDYPGVLVSDCLASYDPHPGRKSKCCAHHLKAISEALEQAPDSEFLLNIRGLFKAAIMLHKLREDLGEDRYRDKVALLERGLDELLEPPRGHAAEIRIRNRLSKHRPSLLTFLHAAQVDPTNNLAERQLRPAVIARKLSCGNKTEAGKAAFEVLASLAATCRQQGQSFSELVAGTLSLGLPPPLFLSPD